MTLIIINNISLLVTLVCAIFGVATCRRPSHTERILYRGVSTFVVVAAVGELASTMYSEPVWPEVVSNISIAAFFIVFYLKGVMFKMGWLKDRRMKS